MKITSITFNNFRCFGEYQLQFKPTVNLLFGVNGCGKTSILRGLKIAMSSFFSGFSDSNTRFIGISNDDFMSEVHDGVESLERQVTISYDFTEFSNMVLKRSGKKNRTAISGIKSLRDFTQTLYLNLSVEDDGSIALPLFAAFSTEDIHSNRKLNRSIFSKYFQPRSFGYYECLQGDGFFEYWMYRLLILQEGQKSLSEIEVVRHAISEALGEGGCNIIRDMSIRPLQKAVYFHFVDGREVDSDKLSDGYKRLVNIVTDLSVRCYILNGKKYGMDCCHETEGVVLIDEVDQHLHPELQLVVIKSLHRAFPKLQFIVSSHAPMVLSSVETNDENGVFHLQYADGSYTAKPIVTYGLDASTILKDYMGNRSRVAEVEESLRHLFELIDEEKLKEAKTVLGSMREKYSDTIPELSRAESMLLFLED